MRESNKELYAIFKSKDARFDGRFYVGISSTRIYCRPVCKARQPKIENCTFYCTAAEAEKDGYRPCLLCRPEIAPGSSVTDSTADLVFKSTRLLEENCGNSQSIFDFAKKLGCTDRHLRRVFASEFNISPIQYLQTCRLLLAKNLLTDTDLSIIDVAMSSGFGSLRRFNDLFKRHYKLTPSKLRKESSEKKPSGITLTLCYRPPYQWDKLISFLSMRAITGVELIKSNEYMRTVRIINEEKKAFYGWLRVTHNPKKNALIVTISETLLPVLSQVLSRVRHLFDMHCDPQTIYESLSSMNQISSNLCVIGTRLPGCFDSFEMSLRAVLGQQISVKAATTLTARIVDKYGTPIATGIKGLTHIFPTPDELLAMDGPIENNFGQLGIIATRSKTIYELALSISQGKINLTIQADPHSEINKLKEIKGIGSWTANYIAMRTIGFTDAFLETDAGIKKALPNLSTKELLKLSEMWQPWRSYATINLWNVL